MRTNNPALNERSFTGARSGDIMTVNGTVEKSAALLFLVVCAAAYTWAASSRPGSSAGAWILGGAIGGLVMAMVTVFKKEWSRVTAPIYAVMEGFFLGGVSAVFEARYRGVVLNAVLLTFGTLGILLVAYRAGFIRATAGFKRGVIIATGAVFLVYMVGMVLSLFGKSIPLIHQNGWIGIAFSLIVVCIAAMNLVLDFDLIEQGAAQGAPRYMEWYGAFALLVTLVWLYLEMLRLLSKLRER